MEKLNPWIAIRAEDYDLHMDHPLVSQLGMLGAITKSQFKSIPMDGRSTALVAILGITNGNGLEHIAPLGIGHVCGIDVNPKFLAVCRQRHANLGDRLVLHCMDMVAEKDRAREAIADADLVIANLVVEHIHLHHFMAIIREQPKSCRISCVVQHNPDGLLCTKSGLESIFDDVLPMMETVDIDRLTRAMASQGRLLALREEYVLPNKKVFIRLDYQ